MWTLLGAAVDAAHALSMALWILGLPLLFWHRWPKLSTAYGIYAVVFVVATRVSHYAHGECFLTTLARRFWSVGGGGSEANEWFTVRFSKLIFGLTPSHREIALASEALVFVTAVGVLISLHRLRKYRSSDRVMTKPAGGNWVAR
jgi:hypothetical protein